MEPSANNLDRPHSSVTIARYGAYQVTKIVMHLSQHDQRGAVPEYWIKPFQEPLTVNFDD